VLGVRYGINAVGVVEWLGTEDVEKKRLAKERRTVIDKGILLHNPDKFLARVVEIELNLVRGRSNGLVTSELKLLNEVLVRVLCHAAALVSVEEDVIDVERRGDERLGVGGGGFSAGAGCALKLVVRGLDGPENFVKWAHFKVNLDLVVLEGNKGESKSRVAAEPELERDVQSCLRKGVARGACVARGA